jgi:hypothetical protein
MRKGAVRAPYLRDLPWHLPYKTKEKPQSGLEIPHSGQEKPQSEYSIHTTKTPTHYKTHTNTNITKPTHGHTLKNNIKPPQYKLKQTQYKIYPNEIVTI